MILLTGATGTLGRVIHRRLLELGEPVRGLSRAPGPELLVQESGLPWTILRATQFHDLIYSLFHAQRRLPVLAVPGRSVQPIDAAAVADRMVELARGEPAGRVPDIGGPQVRTARSLAQDYLEATGRRRRIVKARLPGKAFAAIRAGADLVPGNPVGTVNFEEYLRNRQS